MPCYAFCSRGSSSAACFDHDCDGMGRIGGDGLLSSELDRRNTATAPTPIATNASMVLRCQFSGCMFHQPPAGLQTCLGYKN